MLGYLEILPECLKRDIMQSNCIPIIGAGFSRNAKLPFGKQIPLWDDLGIELAKEIPKYKFRDNPIDVLTEYSSLFGRTALMEELRKLLLIGESKPSMVHFKFAQLKFDTIITTNFDTLLEDSYKNLGKKYMTITNENTLPMSPREDEVRILKIHGDFTDPEKMIVTKDDYDKYFENNVLFATYVGYFLITRTPIFIGYSFNDRDLLTIWEIIGRRLKRMRRLAYTIGLGLENLGGKKWNEKGVKIISIKNNNINHSEKLAKLFTEISESLLNEKSDITSIKEKIKAASFGFTEGEISE